MANSDPNSKARSLSATALIVGFITLLCLPALDSLWRLDRSPAPNEKRVLARMPSFEGLPQTGRFLAGLEGYFNDHFGFRKLLVHWNNQWKFRLFNESPVGMAMVGRDGWLFWAEDRMLENYCGREHFSPQDLLDWQRLLESRRDFLARSGAKYLFVVPPDKHSVYPEFLPSWLVKSPQPSKLDQLLAFLRANSTVEILDLRPALIEARRTAAVYYQTDTHWNACGGFVGCQEIIRALARQMPGLQPLRPEAFDREQITERGGDLAVCLAQENELEEKQAWRFTPRAPLQPLDTTEVLNGKLPDGPKPILTHNPDATGKVIVFRDSFADALIPFLGRHFQQVLYIRHYEWDEALLAREKPDVVIDEIVERKFNTMSPKELLTGAGSGTIASAMPRK